MPTLTDTAFKSKRDVLSTHKAHFVVYTGPSAYVAGGDAFAPADVGLGNIDAVIPCGVAFNGSATRLVTWDRTNETLVWYVPDTGAEAAGDLSAYTLTLLVLGQ